jgi:NAD(P)-dependent dehydrogenase (short-subunit alcohol dehydrogenase family)
MDLGNVAAIVTGGASGLGAATARRLAEAGARVLIADMNDAAGEPLSAELGGAFVHTDVTSPEDVAAAVAVAAELGPLRALVNCAGIGSVGRTINRDGSPHDLGYFASVIAVNLTGTFNCIRLAAEVMSRLDPVDAAGSRGAIVNTASVAAFDGQIGQAAYSASKGGVVGMTLPIARDLSTVGIRVNTIAPGIIDTAMLAALPDEAKTSLGQQVLFPKRLGQPSEYAALAEFLLTHDYMNGETIRMDGGIRMAPK